MMHIPLKTNIAADYITCEAGRQDMEGWEGCLRNGDTGTTAKKNRDAVTLFAFFQSIKEGKNHQSGNKPAFAATRHRLDFTHTLLHVYTPALTAAVFSGVHLKRTFCIF